MTPEQIRQLPEYAELIRVRKKIVWPLSIAMISAYFALIFVIAFSPASLATPISAGVTSVGITLGLGMIVLCFIITGIYVYYANHVIEPLTRNIAQKAGAK